MTLQAGALWIRDLNTRLLTALPSAFARRPFGWNEWAESAGREAPKPSTVVKLNSMIAVARAAERGLGAALVPLPLSDAWFQSGSLVRLFDHELVARDGYYFVYRKEDETRTDIRALREWMLQTFAVDA